MYRYSTVSTLASEQQIEIPTYLFTMFIILHTKKIRPQYTQSSIVNAFGNLKHLKYVEK